MTKHNAILKSMRSSLLLAGIFFLAGSVHAQWRKNGVPIVDTSLNVGSYLLPQIAQDGEGGAIVCWRDSRSGGGLDIYAQLIDSLGVVQWQRNGIPICTASLNQNFPRLISDGEGGAIIAWEDDRDTVETYIFAQKVSHGGQIQWQQNGARVSNKGGLFIRLVSDGTGGVIVAWWSKDYASNYDQVLCQRLNRFGQRMWGDSGVMIDNRSGQIPNNEIAIAADGGNGAVIGWTQNGIIYAQRVDSTGGSLWTPNGLVICNASGGRGVVEVSQFGRNKFVIAWGDQRPNQGYSIGVYAQCVNANGTIQWNSNGKLIAGDASVPVLVKKSDDIMVLLRNASALGARVQLVDSMGATLWDSTGVVVTYGSATNFVFFSDSHGGGITAWEAFQGGGNSDILAQRIDSSGQILWDFNGVALVTDSSLQRYPQAVNDGEGGAIAVWDDQRSYADSTVPDHIGVFCERIYAKGIVASVSSGFGSNFLPIDPLLYPNYPNPFNPETTIRYFLPNYGKVTIVIYDLIGRRMLVLVDQFQHPGEHEVKWDGRRNGGDLLSSGIYFCGMRFDNSFLVNKMLLIR